MKVPIKRLIVVCCVAYFFISPGDKCLPKAVTVKCPGGGSPATVLKGKVEQNNSLGAT